MKLEMQGFRNKIKEEMRKIYDSDQRIISVWEGGSAATGFLDEYSDLDLAIICEDDDIESVFEKTEKYLKETYGIIQKFRMPEPNWHGHSQCFYIIDNCPKYFYVDLLIEKESATNRFTESDRHGNAVIWFDKKSLIDSTPTPKEKVIKKGKQSYKLVNDSFILSIFEVKKQIARGKIVDAYVNYYALINRLSSLLNLKYRPEKVDFGLRYTHRDFPIEETDLLVNLYSISNLKEMKEKVEMVESIFNKLIIELADKWS
jgi:predicted nucleotidyltransferase